VRPARFVDRPPILDVADTGPIPLPRRLDPIKEATLSTAYVERPLVEALDPTRPPDAGDVNAFDDVPRSSWFSPDAAAESDAAEPPAPPFRLLPGPTVTHEGGLAAMDARGRQFELWRDPVDRPEMATGAAAATSRILRALGYYTPGVWARDLSKADFVLHDPADDAAVEAFFKAGPHPKGWRFRVGVTRWPIGTDLGPTPTLGKRADDSNDRVPHQDRRTLRALKPIFGWLGMTEAGAAVLRDAYVGAPGSGHVLHYLAGLGGALGADAVVRPQPPRDDDADLAGRNVWVTLGSLGLYQQTSRLTPKQWPSLGEYREDVSLDDFRTGPPMEPMDRLLPADAYWAAKRIASVRAPVLAPALDAGEYHDDSARALLGELVRDRQRLTVRWGFAQVTPCEVDRLEQAGPRFPAAVILRDEAVSAGLVTAAEAGYRVELLDDDGKPWAKPLRLERVGGALFPVRLAETAPGYVVLRVKSAHSGREAPRAMEVHLVHGGAAWRVVGIVH